MARGTFIVSAVRTPIGAFLGSLSSLSAVELGAIAIKEAVKRGGIDPSLIDEVIMGNVVSAGLGQAPARQAQIKAGITPHVPALTINKVCGSGLKAVVLGAQAIKAGDADIVLAGGMESMSNCPYIIQKARTGYRMGHGQLIDLMISDGLWDSFENKHMGELGEFTAERSGITREMQDEFAFNSHLKAIRAIDNGWFKDEIVPVSVPQKKGEPLIVNTDECPRRDTSIEKLSQLKPAFKPDGTITAGNAPPVNDGASAVLVASEDKVRELNLKPMALITGYAVAAVEPKMLFYAPVEAVRKLLKQLGKKIDYFDLIEINEAFSAQVLADGKELGWDWEKVNVHGGAVALGHPIGASGARILTTLLYAMKRKNAKTGLATLCLGGGSAVALTVAAV
ncbi:MAG: acetyl-CoA C-acetyltransferase [Candidatus Aminicenantia bacterium]